MRSRLRLVCLALAGLALPGCGNDWGIPVESSRPTAAVSFELFGGVESVPAVCRLRVAGGAARSKIEEFQVFEGELSDYHLGRIVAQELPKTLIERAVPLVAWVEGEDVVVAPSRALASGRYALASPELGLVAAFTVDASLVPWLTRRWPPRDVALGSGKQVFCGEAASAVVGGRFSLAPAARAAELTPGFAPNGAFADECVVLSTSEPVLDGAPLLPPALAGGVALEPRPLFAVETAVPAPACTEAERRFGPACATIEDDRLRLRSPDAPTLWVSERPNSSWFVIEAGATTVVKGFEPGLAHPFTARAFDLAGTEWAIDESVTGLAARAHVAINEVLANPSGAEASGEWLELVNDGSADVELAGFSLVDSGGAVELPSHRLAPGAFALLVGPRYDPDPELDVPAPPATALLRLTSLGVSGLSNSGELLRLLDRDGRVISRVPALRSAEAGVSWARRTPDASDDARSFAGHAPPGASPGAPNALGEAESSAP